MAKEKERKRAESKPIVNNEPRKRDEPTPKVVPVKKAVVKKPVVAKVTPKPPLKKGKVPDKAVAKAVVVADIIPDAGEIKVKRSDDKYVRIKFDDNQEERKQMNDRTMKGEFKYAYFAIDNDVYYDYYLVLKK